MQLHYVSYKSDGKLSQYFTISVQCWQVLNYILHKISIFGKNYIIFTNYSTAKLLILSILNEYIFKIYEV